MIQQLLAIGDKEMALPAGKGQSARGGWAEPLTAFLLLTILVSSPVAFASVMPRERLGLGALAFVAFAVACLGSRRRMRGAGAALALAAVGAFGIAQSLTWPAPLAAFVAPAGTEAWQTSQALLATAQSGGAASGVPLSLAPAVSRSTGLFWLAAAAALAASSAVSADRRFRRTLVLGFFTVTVFEIVYGAEAYFEGRPEIWGHELLGGADRLRGTFVNPDHFAMFLVLALATAFAWALWATRRAIDGRRLEARLSYLLPPWLLFLMIFAALAFTGSRAGFVGGIVALFAQSLLLIVERRRWRAALWGLGALGLGMGGLFYLGIERGLARFLGTTAYEMAWSARLEVYRASLELWRDFFWTGTGLGTFRQAFPRVQPADLPLEWIHAHSDVLEMFVTTGLVGPALLVAGMVALGRRFRVGLRRGRRSEDRAMVLAAAGGLTGALGHSLVDFGLTMPANALTLAILIGLACGVRTLPSASVTSELAPAPPST